MAEPGEKRYSRPWPGQEPSVGRQRIQRTEEAQTVNEITDEGIEQRACRLAEVEGESGAAWAEQQGFRGYLGSSLKGEAAIEWNDQAQREQWLTAIVQDARRLLGWAEQAKAAPAEQGEAIAAAAALLERLLAQMEERNRRAVARSSQGQTRMAGPVCMIGRCGTDTRVPANASTATRPP